MFKLCAILIQLKWFGARASLPAQCRFGHFHLIDWVDGRQKSVKFVINLQAFGSCKCTNNWKRQTPLISPSLKSFYFVSSQRRMWREEKKKLAASVVNKLSFHFQNHNNHNTEIKLSTNKTNTSCIAAGCPNRQNPAKITASNPIWNGIFAKNHIIGGTRASQQYD